MSAWRRAVVVAVAGAAFALAADAGRAGGNVLAADAARHVRRAHLPELHGHRGEPRPQQHPGEPAGPRGRHALQRRRCRQPGDRAGPAAELHAAAGLALHDGQGLRVARGRADPGARCRSSPARSRATSSTKTSVPLLDRNGDDTGQTLAGAVTVPLTAGPDRAGREGQLAVGPGRHADRSRAEPAVPGRVRLRRAALRRRRAQRGQRRVDRLPGRREARLLLRLLRRPAADERHDRRPQGRGRPGCHRHAVVRLPGRRLLHPGRDVRDRGVGRQAGLGDLLPRRAGRPGRGASWTCPGG